jgi:hypothetical protein
VIHACRSFDAGAPADALPRRSAQPIEQVSTSWLRIRAGARIKQAHSIGALAGSGPACSNVAIGARSRMSDLGRKRTGGFRDRDRGKLPLVWHRSGALFRLVPREDPGRNAGSRPPARWPRRRSIRMTAGCRRGCAWAHQPMRPTKDCRTAKSPCIQPPQHPPTLLCDPRLPVSVLRQPKLLQSLKRPSTSSSRASTADFGSIAVPRLNA